MAQISEYRALLGSTHWTTRRAVAIKLGNLGPKARAAVFDLISRVDDRYSDVEKAIVQAIARIGVSAADKEKLEGLLSNSSWRARWYGAKFLGELGPVARASIPKLIATTSDRYSSVEKAATKAIEKIGVDTSLIPSLNLLLSSRNWKSRWYGAKFLGQLGEPARQSIPKLIELTSDQYSAVEDAATKAIRKIGVDASLIPTLNTLLSSKNWKSRWYGVTLLGALGEAARPSIPKLIELTSDQYSAVEDAATKAIVQIGIDQSLIPTLNRLLSSKNWKSRWYGARLLGQFGKVVRPSIPKLIELTSDQYSAVEKAAAKAIQQIGVDATLIPSLDRLLSSRNWKSRWYGVKLLGQLGAAARQSIPKLIELTSDQYSAVEDAARKTIPKIGVDTSLIPALNRLLKSAEWKSRYYALQSFGKLGPKSRKSFLAVFECLSDRYESVSELSAKVLRKVGPDTSHIKPLITKSISPEWRFRYHALKMLALVGKDNKSVIAA
ncbi:MAG: HEAT repeat domain-containing protein, partial [Planctomycetota bacterium]|nr:HEAT repeat domain-containing protein [Planctomycetota bacterium]